jgi:hypothetical protein
MGFLLFASLLYYLGLQLRLGAFSTLDVEVLLHTDSMYDAYCITLPNNLLSAESSIHW